MYLFPNKIKETYCEIYIQTPRRGTYHGDDPWKVENENVGCRNISLHLVPSEVLGIFPQTPRGEKFWMWSKDQKRALKEGVFLRVYLPNPHSTESKTQGRKETKKCDYCKVLGKALWIVKLHKTEDCCLLKILKSNGTYSSNTGYKKCTQKKKTGLHLFIQDCVGK